MPDIGTDLTPQQSLACALRILARAGWQENLSGHITVALDATTMIVNPWGLWWEEVRARDIMTINSDGTILDGPWDVTPAVFLHTELHRVRPDARVVIHNHPVHATLLACIGERPVISHQNAALFDGEIAFINEYDGTVESESAGAALAREVGSATVALLAHHGAIVTGDSFGSACYRAVTFERACQFTVDALKMQRELRPLPRANIENLQAELKRNTAEAFWGGALRQLISNEPEVLT